MTRKEFRYSPIVHLQNEQYFVTSFTCLLIINLLGIGIAIGSFWVSHDLSFIF